MSCLDDGLAGGLRLPSLRNRQRAGPMGQHGTRNACEYKARQDRNGKGVLLDFLMPGIVGQPEDNVLNLVVDPSTYPEGVGLRIRSEIV